MHRPPHYQCLRIVIDRLKQLDAILENGSTTLDGIANEIESKIFRENVRYAAQQLKQINAEVQSLTSSLKAKSITESMGAESVVHHHNEQTSRRPTLMVCLDTEKQILKAYRSILNEPALLPDMRHMLQRHLNCVLTSFMQLKMLDYVPGLRVV